MSITTLYDLAEHQMIEHIKKNGGYNAFPPNWQEITTKEYVQSRNFCFEPVLVEHRQMIWKGEVRQPGPMTAASLRWQSDGTGFTEVVDHWAGTIKFFKFGERPADLVEQFDSSD